MVILLWGGIFWRDRDTVLDTGPLKVETSERRGVALPPLLGAAVLVAGIAIVWAEETGDRSRREAMTMPTTRDAMAMRTT